MTDKLMTPEELAFELFDHFVYGGWESHEAVDIVTQYTAAIRQAARDELMGELTVLNLKSQPAEKLLDELKSAAKRGPTPEEINSQRDGWARSCLKSQPSSENGRN